MVEAAPDIRAGRAWFSQHWEELMEPAPEGMCCVLSSDCRHLLGFAPTWEEAKALGLAMGEPAPELIFKPIEDCIIF